MLVKPNQKVTIILLEGTERQEYSTYVEAVTAGVIAVAAPLATGLPVAFQPGQQVRVEYLHERTRVAFSTRVIGAGVDTVPIVRLEAPNPQDIDRLQQRDFVRQEANLTLTLRVVSSSEPVYESRTREISAGGAQILCPREYPTGTRLDIQLDLKGAPLRLFGEVLRPLRSLNDGRCWVGVRFLGLTDRDRDAIVRCIFDIQRDLRRRGLF